MTATAALSAIPDGLRKPLLDAYRLIVQNYLEHKWLPSELSGGHLCEIIFTICKGYATGSYPSAPEPSPRDFPSACRSLESHSHVPRSMQILIPRMLPPLYEIRNNRKVGHASGDVDPNHMDATLVLSMANWLMGELVRVFHQLNIREAQKVVDGLAERRIPLIWQGDDVRRVLDSKLSLTDQSLLLVASTDGKVKADELQNWLDYKDRKYFRRMLQGLHKKRFINLADDFSTVEILPPGGKYIQEFLSKRLSA